MSTKQLTLNEFSEFLKEYPNKHVEEVKKHVVAGVVRSIPDLVRASPVDQGYYAASWNFTVDELRVMLGNYAPHAPIIEHGARPFTPPIAPLLAWAKRVLKDSSQPGAYSNRVWALARATQMKIAREGIKPKHILQNALPGIIQNIKDEFING